MLNDSRRPAGSSVAMSMHQKLDVLIEGIWLLIIFLLPVYFNPLFYYAFYFAKATLLVLLVSLLLGLVLVPRIGGGRVAAVEIMLANSAVKNLIREGKPFLIPNTIRTNSNAGMKTLDDALVDLYRDGIISREYVFAFCHDAEDVNKTLRAGGPAR